MSRLLHNIKSAALALAALALAAPQAWGAEYTWKDGASGNTNVGSNWTGGTAPTSGVNKPIFNNTGTALSTVNNNITMSNSTRFDDGTVKNGVFSFTGNWYFKTFSMADTENSQAAVTKTGTWTCNNGGGATYQFRYGVGPNSKASFTNVSGNIGDIGTGRTTRDMDFTVGHGEGSDAEFILKAGTVTSSTALVLGYGTSSKGLLVMDGGAMNCKTTNVVARGTGSTGIARINGGTFTGNSKPFYVAKGANSTGMVVVNGGTLQTADVFLGDADGANASVIVSNGTLNATGHFRMGYKAGVVTTNYLEVAGGTFTQSASKNVYVGSSAGLAGTKSELCVKGSGVMNLQNLLIVGYSAGGTVTIEDGGQIVMKASTGGVNMGYSSTHNGDDCRLNLFGGTLGTYKIDSSAGSAPSYVTFDGGTLKANAANAAFVADKANIHVAVGAKGGTVDSAGFAITIPKAFESGVSGETDGGMTFKGGGTVTLTGANTYTGATVIDAGTTIQMPAANNLAGNIVVTNATLADCPITVLALTNENAVVDAALLARCSLAADADTDKIELTMDGASVMVTAKAGQPTTARLIYDSGTDSWNWEFRDTTDAVISSVDQSALEAGSVTVIFGSTAELAAIGTTPAWASGYQMAATFDLDAASVSTALPSEFTVEAGTVIDMKGCAWTLPAGLKSATVDFTVTNSVDATKAVLTVDVASGATFTETHLTLGGNIELRKTGEGTYTMTKDQAHTGGTVVVAGSMAKADTVTVAPASGSAQSLSVEGGSLDISNSGHLIVGGNGVGEFTITNATASMNNFFIGSNSGTGSGTANIDGGTVTVNGWSYLAISVNSGGAVLNLNGGTLGTRRINVGTVPDSLILFNGGTLHINGVTAAADTGFSIGTSSGTTPERLTIAVGEKGGTIKTTHSEDRVKICSGIVKASGVETDGGLRIMGGGKLTLTGSLAYTGGTTVEVGTTLVIPDTSLGGGLSVEFPETTPAAGTYTLVTTTGSTPFTDADIAGVSLPPFYRALLSADGKSIQIARVAPSITVTGFDKASGNVTVALENIDVPLSLVVAWGDKDYGATLTSWPYNKRSILAASVAARTTTATYTLPAEARAAGAYWRMFLGDGAVAPYDEEVAYIQPAVLGAYIATDIVPSASPQMELEINLNSQSYTTSYVTLFDAGTGYSANFWTFANAEGKIGGRRGGYATFGPFSTTDNLHVKFDWAYPSSSHKPVTVNGTGYTHNNFNQGDTITPTAKLRFWHYAHNGSNITELNNSVGYSAYQLYYAKLLNSSGTLQAHFVPVKKDDVYGLYDVVNQKLYTNAGAEGTSFKGGEKVTTYSPVYFGGGQLAASPVRMMGTVELASRDWERPEEHVTLTWTAPGASATLWVVYSNTPTTSAPGAFADPSEWDGCVKLDDVAANGETGTYTLENPYGTGYKTMRFVLATRGSTEDNLVPLLVSEPYRTRRRGLSIYIR